jgi:hypothetical protein
LATTIHPTVIGVFSNADQTNGAIDELRHANVGCDRIRVGVYGSTVDSLTKMGPPDDEVRYYQRESRPDADEHG